MERFFQYFFDGLSFGGIYALFAALSLPLYWESSRYFVLVTPEGLERRSAWRRYCVMAWDDIQKVTFSTINAWFVFHAENGDKIRVSTLMAGVTDLLRLVELQLPPDVLKPARVGYERIGRPFPNFNDEPILEARPPRRRA